MAKPIVRNLKAQPYILKDISKMEEEVSVYEFVEDDKEYDAIAAIFKEIMDDVDFK